MMLAGGCDTHVHIIGDAHAYPMVAERHYTPGPATVDQLKTHLTSQGLSRAVIIQPSVYGTKNQCLLDALDAMHGQARGIAVLDTSIDTAALKALEARGVRGIRLNLESSGANNMTALQSALQHWAPRLADLGWHIQVYAPWAVTLACADVIGQLPVPVVLDHFALWPDASCSSTESLTLLRLLKLGHIYIKLSGSYRTPLQDAAAHVAVSQQLLATRPDRLLWASDWPHTNREAGRQAHEISRYRDIDSLALQHERTSWLSTPALQHQVLVDNPQRLYRF
jgi:predicted TIM-barrel fold metal-dependent hydrolase